MFISHLNSTQTAIENFACYLINLQNKNYILHKQVSVEASYTASFLLRFSVPMYMWLGVIILSLD